MGHVHIQAYEKELVRARRLEEEKARAFIIASMIPPLRQPIVNLTA